jgi:hypothetical protein
MPADEWMREAAESRSRSPAGTADPADVNRLASWTRKFSNLRVAERSTGSYEALALLRWALVIVFLWFGGMKFTGYEANGFSPFIQHSPILNWLNALPGVQGRAFHPSALQVGHFSDVYEFFPLQQFIEWLRNEETLPPGTPIVAELLSIEVTGTVAVVKLTDTCFGTDFTDYLVMVKDRPDPAGRWQIVTKAYHVHSGRGLPPATS